MTPSENRKSGNTCALVLGGYVNGYSIIRELHEHEIKNIWLFDYGKSMSRWSNWILGFDRIEKTPQSLKAKIEALHLRFEYIVLYPTDDLQLELLSEIYDDIVEYCFLPFTRSSLVSSLDKSTQYAHCESLGIPYPKTQTLSSETDFGTVSELNFPLIIKPTKRDDLTSSVFRSIYVDSISQFTAHKGMLLTHMKQGISFLASEFVPGDDTQIYAYTAYRSKSGKILNEWIGKKLTQFPDIFGVFSSASNDAPEIVRLQGRILLDGMNLTGIAEPEFKLDVRDGKYKLMEINLRSMMWHRLGNLCGVPLQYSQWLDALGQTVPQRQQVAKDRIHFIYMKHELINLFTRRGYLGHFAHNVWGGDKRYFAVFDSSDLKPFLYDIFVSFPKGIVALCLKAFRKL